MLVGLNLVNPDAMIARINLGRVAQGGRFDAAYAAALSADALPVLVEALPSLPLDQRCQLVSELRRRWSGQRPLARWTLALHMTTGLVPTEGVSPPGARCSDHPRERAPL